jgi:hypothetical protein
MFGKKSTPRAFWKWFLDNDDMLSNFEQDTETIFDLLASKLRQIDPNLTFEFGPAIEGIREFVISAGGIKSAFPAVTAIVGAAPRLERWQITAFRPRRPLLMVIEFQGKSVDPKLVEFSLIDDGKNIGVYLFIPGYDEQDSNWQVIGYLLLDEALGEFDVETKVGPVRMFPPEATIGTQRFPLPHLPEIFDRHLLTLENRAKGHLAKRLPN